MWHLTFLFLFSFLLFNTVNLWAQPSDLLINETNLKEIEPALKDILLNEDVLTQNDLKIYLANYRLFGQTINEKTKLNELLINTGFTETRLSYVLIKISVGLEMIMDIENSKWELVDEAYKPNKGELELLEKNKDVLLKALSTVVKIEE